MAVSVRDTLEKLGHSVDYDKATGGVLVTDKNGKKVNIGSEGFTLGDDNRYYANSANDVYAALSKSGMGAGSGWSAVRNTLSPTESVGYNQKTGQLAVNGKTYNVDNENLVNIGGTIYGKSNFVNSLKKDKYENSFSELERSVLNKLKNNTYSGYNPSADEDYQMAYKDYVKSAKEDMGARGLTSDSLISHYASEGAAKLMPQYAKADYEKYKDENDRLRSLLYTMKNLDESDRSTFQARENSDYKAAELELSRAKTVIDEIAGDVNMAVKRSEATGYVGEKDAAILGVEPGTLTAEMQEKINDRIYEIEKLNLQNELDIEGYRQKSDIDEEAAQRDFQREIEMLRLSTQAKAEIARLQKDLDISLAQATAYYKMIYGK